MTTANDGASLGIVGLPLQKGSLLSKKYRVEKLIGEGVTGIVTEATHLLLDQKVAIKFLRPALASPEIVQRFDREARAISKIQSEHVVLVLDVGALDDGMPYMVMEHLDGTDLQKLLKAEKKLPVGVAVDCMMQVCEALSDAHAEGIIHRDLKPANLFLTRRDDGAVHVKVVDFGISKILRSDVSGSTDEMTAAFTAMGSPRYTAPEQLRDSKHVDRRADIWSVGAVLFHLVTGKYPFDGETAVEATLKVFAAAPPKLTELVPDAPEGLTEVLERCLEKDPARRYQTALELADALEGFASEGARESLARVRAAKGAPVMPTGEDAPTLSKSSQRMKEDLAPKMARARRNFLLFSAIIAVVLLVACGVALARVRRGRVW